MSDTLMTVAPADPPPVQQLTVGIDATGTRTETDPLGPIDVPADRYWGAETQRSLVHFSIGDDHMPKAVCRAYGYVKKAAASIKRADAEGTTLRAAALKSGEVSAAEFDRIVDARAMTGLVG